MPTEMLLKSPQPTSLLYVLLYACFTPSSAASDDRNLYNAASGRAVVQQDNYFNSSFPW